MRFRLREAYSDGTSAPITADKEGVVQHTDEVDAKLGEGVTFSTLGSHEVTVRMIGDNYVEVILR